jgi:Transglycosylase-like domain
MFRKRTPGHKLSAFAITAAGAIAVGAVAAGAATSATTVSHPTGHATVASSAQLTPAGSSRPHGAIVLDAYTRPAFYEDGSFEACVISHESSGNPRAVNPASGAGGLYGFMPSTWASIGFSGLPENAPVATQHAAFQRLYAIQGSAPWRGDGCA